MSTTLPTPTRHRRRSSAVNATLAKRTKRTTRTTSRPCSSRPKLICEGESTSLPFFYERENEALMKNQLPIWLLVIAAVSGAFGQMASHAPTMGAKSDMGSVLQVSDKPVARVNGVILTDRDLLREMYAIFPYAQQHNGFPKGQEETIRQGALEMIIFEELVFQEAGRRNLAILPDNLQ